MSTTCFLKNLFHIFVFLKNAFCKMWTSQLFCYQTVLNHQQLVKLYEKPSKLEVEFLKISALMIKTKISGTTTKLYDLMTTTQHVFLRIYSTFLYSLLTKHKSFPPELPIPTIIFYFIGSPLSCSLKR